MNDKTDNFIGGLLSLNKIGCVDPSPKLIQLNSAKLASWVTTAANASRDELSRVGWCHHSKNWTQQKSRQFAVGHKVLNML